MTVIDKLQKLTRRHSVAVSATGAYADPAGDLRRHRNQLSARLAELQWDLGGLVYEMTIRDSLRKDVILQRAAVLQDVDAELSEVERILRIEDTGTAGECPGCGAPHSSGAVYCWQCGATLLEPMPSGRPLEHAATPLVQPAEALEQV